MAGNNKVVRIFTAPLAYPCGPNSSCCGPTGMSGEDRERLAAAIKELGVEVEVYDMSEDGFAEKFPEVSDLLESFGPGIVPVLSMGDGIVAMGAASPEEAVRAIKEKL